MSVNTLIEKIFLIESIVFAGLPAAITVVLYYLDKSTAALPINNMIYSSAIIVGLAGNTIVSAHLHQVNDKAVPFLAMLVFVLVILSFVVTSISPFEGSVLSISSLYIMREIVRFRRHVFGIFFVSLIMWMPIFVYLWVTIGEKGSALVLLGYVLAVFLFTTAKLVNFKIDYVLLCKSYKLIPSAMVDQGFSSGINLIYINTTMLVYGPLLIRAISLVDVFHNIIGGHILSRAGKNRSSSVAKFLVITSRKIRYYLIAPTLFISIASAYFGEAKLALICLLKGVKYFVGWTFKVLLLMSRQTLFFYVHLLFAITLGGLLVILENNQLFYVFVILGVFYHLVGFHFASIEASTLIKTRVSKAVNLGKQGGV